MASFADASGAIKTENYPSISLCIDSSNSYNYVNDNKFSKSLTQYNLSGKLLKNISTKEKSPLKLNPIEERNISIYLNLLKYTMLSDMLCYRDRSNSTKKCMDKGEMILSESILGKCYTFLSGLNDPNNEAKLIKNTTNFEILEKILFDESKLYPKFIHDRNQLPSLAFRDTTLLINTTYSLIKVKRLPPPYDSNCFNYEFEALIKSRGHCINYCIIDKILKKYGCIPENMRQYLTLFDNISLDSTFCSDKDFGKFEDKECRNRCLMSCKESFFTINSYITENFIEPEKNNYVIYIHKIYMTFINFMMSFGGLLGLWNNISIYDLQLILLKIFGNLLDSKFMKNFSKSLNLILIKKLFKLFKKCLIKFNFKVN
jgi:hypothetical protein